MPKKSSRRNTQKKIPIRRRLQRMYVALAALGGVLLVVVLFVPEVAVDESAPEEDAITTERYPPEEEGRQPGPAPAGKRQPGGAVAPDESVPQVESTPESRGAEESKAEDPRPGPERESEQPRSVPEREPKPEPGSNGSLAIVIDDVGNSLADLESFLAFEGPLTFAVLPQRKYSTESAKRIAAAGKEAILHLPMEPVSGMDPGAGAIRVGMSEKDIIETLRTNLESVPGIRGVNNHMGSRATADPVVMDIVLSNLKEEGLFFLDSRTSVKTVASYTAETHDLPYLERAVFLDNESNRDYIRNAVREGMQIAERKGHAVMIGHVMVNELVEVLNEMYPFIQDEGFDLRYLSELVLNEEFDDDPRS